MNYESIKVLAKQKGCAITDLIALSRNNDPFYVGTSGDLEKGEWFANLWEHFGLQWGVHIRRVHYKVISQETPVLMPNGLPYENTEACWDFLSQASKSARYLNLVDPAAFVDRRNPEPHIYLHNNENEPSINVYSDMWGAASFPYFPDLPTYSIDDYRGKQRYHLEIWCEKSTANDVLIPLCSQYGANLVTGLGEMSITAVLELTRRMDHRPIRIFYVSDFDPAGQSIPCSVSRKIEYFLRKQDDNADVKLFPIVLSLDQVKQYRLPRTPIKDSERRGARFEERYGAGAVELDALEALRPSELRRIVETEIKKYFDDDLDGRVEDVEAELRDRLDAIHHYIIEEHRSDIDALQGEYNTIRGDFEERMRSYGKRLQRVWQAVSLNLKMAAPHIAEHPIPEPDIRAELDDALYDAKRDYIDQLAAYKEWQGKGAAR